MQAKIRRVKGLVYIRFTFAAHHRRKQQTKKWRGADDDRF
jgi:hypothetical protein